MFDTVSVTVSTKADVVDMPSYFCVDEWVASLDRRRVVVRTTARAMRSRCCFTEPARR